MIGGLRGPCFRTSLSHALSLSLSLPPTFRDNRVLSFKVDHSSEPMAIATSRSLICIRCFVIALRHIRHDLMHPCTTVQRKRSQSRKLPTQYSRPKTHPCKIAMNGFNSSNTSATFVATAFTSSNLEKNDRVSGADMLSFATATMLLAVS